MTDCIFCKIVSGEIPSKKIYENDYVYAFEDLSPQAPFHCLVIPKKHITTINDIEEEDVNIAGHMLLAAKKIAASHSFDEDGYRLVMNCNEDGGQTVYHIHMHILAGRQLTWPPG